MVIEKEPEKHQTIIEWETDTEIVKITFRVERTPKEDESDTDADPA